MSQPVAQCGTAHILGDAPARTGARHHRQGRARDLMTDDTTTMDGYRIEPLSPETWESFAGLVERHNGIFGGCWCTYFHPECADREPGYEGRAGACGAGDARRGGDRVGAVRPTGRAAEHPPSQAVRRGKGQ